jgi:hypothetical protein
MVLPFLIANSVSGRSRGQPQRHRGRVEQRRHQENDRRTVSLLAPSKVAR